MADGNIVHEAERIAQGILYCDQKKYDLAIAEFHKVLRDNPRNDTARVKLGHVYLQQKKFFEAVNQFEKAAEVCPESAEPYEGQGFCYFGLGRIEEAIDKFNYALRLNPNSEHTHFGLGLCYHRNKEFDKAREHLDRVETINPRHPQVNYHLGLCYYQKENYSQAVVQFHKALEIDPEYWRAHEGLAFVYLEEDKFELCLEELRHITGVCPPSETYHHIMARLYLKQKKDGPAIEELEKMLAINPQSEFACEALAKIYSRQKKYSLAREYLQTLLHADPSNASIYQDLGNIYIKEGNYAGACVQFRKALEINPEYWHAHEGLAFVYLEEDKLELCRKELSHRNELYPPSEAYHQIMARLYLKQKKDGPAIEELQKILGINPQSEFACEALMRIYCRQQKYDLAKDRINALLAMDSSKFYLYQELGAIYVIEKNYAEALCQFKMALAGYSGEKSVDAKNTMSIGLVCKDIGSTYLLMQNYSSAVSYLKQAMEIDPSDASVHRFLAKTYIEMRDYDSAVTVLSGKYDHFDAADKIDSRTDDGKRIQGGERIKLLRIPNFYNPEILSTEMNSIMLPPLALGGITSYVRSHGIRMDQDDLHIKIHYDNYFSKDPAKKIDETVFFDDRRVLEYSSGADDPEMDELMERVCAKTEVAGYQLILFSLDPCSMNFSHAMFALCFARFLKKKYNAVIILGGLRYFPELMQKIQCTWPDIDYVICNDGEDVLVELLTSLFNAPCLEAKVKSDMHRRVLSCAEVPKPVKPDFDGLPLERYAYRGLKADLYDTEELRALIKEFNASKTLLLPVRFIKGCTNKCIFCASSHGGLIHVVDPRTVGSWLEELQKKYEPTGYLFLNDTLNISKKYLVQVCHEIIKRKLAIRWSDCVRVDRLDKDSIYAMRDAGCIRMVFGMETASKRLLKYIHKDIDLDQLEDMLSCAHKAGIWTGIEIISGLPHENARDVKETISFLHHNKRNIDALYYNAFNIKDTSLLQEYPEQYGITNIFEISSYEDGFATFVKYGFDEINGLPWTEKKKQVIASLYKIIETFGEVPFPEHEYEHFLFFLYTKFDDKKIIRDLFYAVGAAKMKYVKSLRRSKELGEEAALPEGKVLFYGGR